MSTGRSSTGRSDGRSSSRQSDDGGAFPSRLSVSVCLELSLSGNLCLSEHEDVQDIRSKRSWQTTQLRE